MTQFKKITALVLSAMALSACQTTKPFDAKANFTQASETALVIVSTRVNDENAKFGEPIVSFVPYDVEGKKFSTRKNKLPGKPFSVGRGSGMLGNGDRKEWADHVIEVKPGTYLIHSARLDTPAHQTTFTLGTVAFDVKPGEVLHLGQYNLHFPNHKKISVGDALKEAGKMFFTLGLVGMPDPIISAVRIEQNDDRLNEILKKYTNVHSQPKAVNYIKDIQFNAKGVELIYQVEVSE